MGTYTYIGITAYVNKCEGNSQRFRLLAELFNPFAHRHEVSAHCDVHPHFEALMQSDAFKNIDNHYELFMAKAPYYPKNTPDEYLWVKVEDVEIKGHEFTRMYFPMVQIDILDSRRVEQDLLKVLMNVFGTDLVNVKRKEDVENRDFHAIPSAIQYAQANQIKN